MRVLAEGQQAERPVAGAERFNLSKQEIEAIVSSESPSASKCFSLYLYFEMVENNNKQAMPWLIQAAVGNDAGAQYTYGVILSERPETLNLGINWLKKSKANGYEPAGPTLERLEKKRDKLRK